MGEAPVPARTSGGRPLYAAHGALRPCRI